MAPTDSTASAVSPLTSLAALRQRHAELLKKVPAEGPDPEQLAEVQQFLRSGATVGEWLDLPAEREEAQGILDYWRATLYAQNRARQASSPTESSGDKVRLKSAVLAPFNEQALRYIADAAENSLQTALREHPELQDVGRRVLLRLVRMDETTMRFILVPARRSELVALAPPGKVAKMLTLLERAGLLTIQAELQSGDDQVQLSHEALTRVWTRLAGALEKRILFRDAALFWDKHGRDRNALFTGDLLKEAEAYQDLNPLERAFVDACRAEAKRLADLEESRRTRRRITRNVITAVILTVLSIAVVSHAFYAKARADRTEAESKRAQAEAEELKADAARKQAEIDFIKAEAARQKALLLAKSEAEAKAEQADKTALVFAMFGWSYYYLLVGQYSSGVFQTGAIESVPQTKALLKKLGPPDIDALVALAERAPKASGDPKEKLKFVDPEEKLTMQLAFGAVQALELIAPYVNRIDYYRILDELQKIGNDDNINDGIRKAATHSIQQVLLANAKIVVQLSPALQFGLQGRSAAGELIQITYSPKGSTNRTTLVVDDVSLKFGSGKQKGVTVGPTTGLPDAPDGAKRPGLQSTWYYEKRSSRRSYQILQVTQILELVKSDAEWDKRPGGKPDTCLVGYVVRVVYNRSGDVKISLTAEIDTCIGGDDANLFELMGKDGSKKVITKPTPLKAPDIPPYIKAFNPKDPAFSVWFTRLPGPNSQWRPVIAPSRVDIHNLGEHLSADADQQSVEELDDSAISFHWGPVNLASGAGCRFAYAIGLGRLTQETLEAQNPLIAERRN
jgi:hypothetical protein